MAALVTLRFNAADLKALVDPQLIARAESQMIESGIDVLVPLARSEAPVRTGRGRASIAGVVDRSAGGHLLGRVHAGKAFQLRLQATGRKGFEERPKRFASKRKSRLAARALGPGKASGALRALKFSLGGSVLFRSFVRIPARAPNDFFERAARRGEGAVGHAAEVVVQAAIDRVTSRG